MNTTAIGSIAGKALWGLILTVLYLFLLAPIIIIAIMSFSSASDLSFPPPGWTFDWYLALLSNEAFLRGAQISFVVALGATALSVLVAVPAGLAIARYEFPGRAAIETLFLAPILVPAIVVGLGLLMVLSPIGLTGTYPGLIFAMFSVTVPYVMRTILARLRANDYSSEEAARVLGDNPLRVFLRVTLPMVAPGIAAGALMAFLIAFDEVVIALFIVRGGAPTLAVAMFDYIQYQADPQVAAVSVVLVAFSVIVLVVVERTVGINKALK